MWLTITDNNSFCIQDKNMNSSQFQFILSNLLKISWRFKQMVHHFHNIITTDDHGNDNEFFSGPVYNWSYISLVPVGITAKDSRHPKPEHTRRKILTIKPQHTRRKILTKKPQHTRSEGEWRFHESIAANILFPPH